MNLLVTVAMISITTNTLLFRSIDRIERAIHRVSWLWNMLEGRHARRAAATGSPLPTADDADPRPRAVIVGYGPVGRLVDALLTEAGFRTVVVEMNIDTVRTLSQQGRAAVYGDASRGEVLASAGLRGAVHLAITLGDSGCVYGIVRAAREADAEVEIITRAQYLSERDVLLSCGANAVIVEEGEAGVAIARHVLRRQGKDPSTVDRRSSRWRDAPALEDRRLTSAAARRFGTVDELNQALRDFARRFNNHWIIGRIGYRTPAAHRRILLEEAA